MRVHKNFPTTDNFREEAFFPSVHKSYFLSVAKEPKTRYIRKMSDALAGLIRELGYDSLIFMGDGERPWLYRCGENTDKSKTIAEAIEYFIANKVGKRFNGALVANTSRLPEAFRHIYWLTSTNSALPIFHFMDNGGNILGSICQYGVVHFYTLNKAADDLFKLIARDTSTLLLGTECSAPYGK